MNQKSKKCFTNAQESVPPKNKCFRTKLGVNDALKLELKTASICYEMECNGFPLDKEECKKQIDQLQQRIEWVDNAILPFIPPKPVKDKTTIAKVFKINGEYTKQVKDWLEEGGLPATDVCVCGPFDRIKYSPINLNSSVQVNKWLLDNGWKPTEWNYKKDSRGKDYKDAYGNKIKTSPKITEDSLDSLEELGIAGKLIAYRRKCTHKQNQLKGFLRDCRDDGTVPSVVNTLGAATRRMTHQKIVNVPTPKKGQFWKYMRKVFWSGSDDYVVVGCDASQIQIRGLAHYAAVVCNDRQMIEDLVNSDEGKGPDIHTLNGSRADCPRSESKGIFYGYLFGAGLAKTAKQLNKTVKATERVRKKFDESIPFLSNLVNHLIKFYRSHGYITGIDGTKIYAESEHMLLVYLLQNFEAVFMKVALCYATDRIKKQKLKAKLVTMQHDELQFVCYGKDAKNLSKLLEKSMQDAGKFIGSECPVRGEAKIGKTWYDTH